MASNLDYLDPSLQPLEAKVTAYLAAEEDLRQLVVEAHTHQAEAADTFAATQTFDQRPATGSFDQPGDELQQRRQNLQSTIQQLREDILALLPTRDEWVKVNLGYGPSRVGAFRDEAAPADAPAQYLIRVVQ